MQDEINEKTVALYIKTGKLTAEVLQKAIKKLLSQMKKELDRQAIPHGKQTLKQLGVGDNGIYQLQNVLFTPQIGKGIVAHGLLEIDCVQHFYLIAAPL